MTPGRRREDLLQTDLWTALFRTATHNTGWGFLQQQRTAVTSLCGVTPGVVGVPSGGGDMYYTDLGTRIEAQGPKGQSPVCCSVRLLWLPRRYLHVTMKNVSMRFACKPMQVCVCVCGCVECAPLHTYVRIC